MAASVVRRDSTASTARCTLPARPDTRGAPLTKTPPAQGSFTCLSCATACAPGTACADGTALGCSACREGYARPAGREAGCEDLDECADGTADCGPGFRCANTPGLFECVCDPPRVAEGGTCEEPAPGASDDAKDEL